MIPANPYISLDEAKGQLSVDAGLTIHDQRIALLIGAAIDWAENFTQRSLGELEELDSPRDSEAEPLPDPKDSPQFEGNPNLTAQVGFVGVEGFRGDLGWTEKNYLDYWAHNPLAVDSSRPLRRDVKAAILLKIEVLFDRNTDNWELIEDTAESMLFPYRVAMGV
jgi:hypothetical protein